jgi:hypothetical protein
VGEADERRRAQRVVPRHTVHAVVESARDSARSVVADVSEGGAALLPARRGLRTDDELILSLTFPGHDSVAATGRVVWVMKSERQPGRFGVRWTHVGLHRERLEALIRHCG